MGGKTSSRIVQTRMNAILHSIRATHRLVVITIVTTVEEGNLVTGTMTEEGNRIIIILTIGVSEVTLVLVVAAMVTNFITTVGITSILVTLLITLKLLIGLRGTVVAIMAMEMGGTMAPIVEEGTAEATTVKLEIGLQCKYLPHLLFLDRPQLRSRRLLWHRLLQKAQFRNKSRRQ